MTYTFYEHQKTILIGIISGMIVWVFSQLYTIFQPIGFQRLVLFCLGGLIISYIVITPLTWFLFKQIEPKY